MGHAGSDAEVGLPDPGRDRRRLRPRPAARHRPAAGRRAGCARRTRCWRALRRRSAARSADVAEQVLAEPQLTTAGEVMAPLAPRHPDRPGRPRGRRRAGRRSRRRCPSRRPLTLAQSINRAPGRRCWPTTRRRWCSARTSRVKGGVYGVTRGLRKRFGGGPGVRHAAGRAGDPRARARAGAGRASCRCPRSSTWPTCTTPRTSSAARRRPAVLLQRAATATRWCVRVAGLAYQKGFGGHFHNDNSVAVLRDIPGLVVAVPSRPDDAAAMLRTCVGRGAGWTAGSACSSSRSRCTTAATCTSRATAAGWRRSPEPGRDTCRSAPARLHGDGADLTHRDVRQRGADEPAGRPDAGRRRGRTPGCWTCAGCAPLPVDDLLREPRRHRPGAGRRRDPPLGRGVGGVVAALVDGGFAGRSRGWPARTASSRSAPPRSWCCSTRRRWRPRRSRCSTPDGCRITRGPW